MNGIHHIAYNLAIELLDSLKSILPASKDDLSCNDWLLGNDSCSHNLDLDRAHGSLDVCGGGSWGELLSLDSAWSCKTLDLDLLQLATLRG